MVRLIRGLCTGLVVVAAVPVANAAVEEITVSAQRRDESLQEVPIAVSAFAVDDIRKLQIDVTTDLGAAVPNMQTYNITANANAMQVFMRGAGIQNPGFNASESPVGIYVDNIFRGRLATANLDLTDIERIEVLRGPQGTLYGRNTIAGAVKVITRTPEDEFWADAGIGFGNYETTKVTASVGGPIADGWGASLAGLYNKRNDGWIDRGSTGGRSLGEYDNKALRGKLNFFGSERFGATVSLGYVDAENDGYNGIPYGPVFNGNPGEPTSAPGQPLEGFYDSLVPDGSVGLGKTEQLNSSLELVWNATDALTIKSITGYSDIDDTFRFDLNGGAFQDGGPPVGPIFTGGPGVLINSDSSNKTISQEFVFQGSIADNIDWIAGVFYLNEEGDQLYSPAVVVTGDAITEAVSTDTTSYAVYAEGTWNITDAWSATLGGRWTRDEKEYINNCTTTPGVGGFPACLDLTATPADWTVDLDEEFDEFTPRFLVQYQLNEGTSFYGSYSQGFQAGGFQTLCFGSQLCSQQVYDPQSVDSYELGAKTELLDRTLRINAAIFRAEYEDIQQTGILLPGVPIFPVLNVGESEVNGLELEVNWSPTDSLNLFLIGAYADDEIDADQLPGGGGSIIAGTDLPGLPETTLRVGGDWRVGVFGDWDFLVGGDVNYVDEYFATINNVLLVPSYTRVNGFIGLNQPDGPWSVVLRGKNLTDQDDYVSGISGAGTNIRTPLAPREYMLDVNFRYR